MIEQPAIEPLKRMTAASKKICENLFSAA